MKCKNCTNETNSTSGLCDNCIPEANNFVQAGRTIKCFACSNIDNRFADCKLFKYGCPCICHDKLEKKVIKGAKKVAKEFKNVFKRLKDE